MIETVRVTYVRVEQSPNCLNRTGLEFTTLMETLLNHPNASAECWKTNAYLKSLDLYIHSDLKLLLCTQHNCCLTLKNACSHLSYSHSLKDDAIQEFKRQLVLIGLSGYDTTEFQEWQADKVKLFYSLQVPMPLIPILYKNAVKCLLCPSSYFKDSHSSLNHFKTVHSTLEKQLSPGVHWVQTLFKGTSERHLFKVNEQQEPPLTCLLSMLNDAMAPVKSVSTEDSLISSFEQHYGWIKYIQGYSSLELCSLLCSSDPIGELEVTRVKSLNKLIAEYISIVNDNLLESATMYVLRKIADIEEKNVSSGCGFTGLQTSKAKQKYGNTLLRCLLFALRCSFNPLFIAYSPLLVPFKQQLGVFDEKLIDGTGTVDDLHAVLRPLFFQIANPNQDKSCFIMAEFIIFSNALQNGKLLECHLATQGVAHVQYLMRCCVVYCIVKEKESLDICKFVHCKENTSFGMVTNYGQLLRTFKDVQANQVRYVWATSQDGNMDYSSILIGSDTLELDQLRHGYQTLLSEFERKLQSLQHGYLFKSFESRHVYDDLGNTDPGYYFLVDPRNSHLMQETRNFCKHLDDGLLDGLNKKNAGLFFQTCRDLLKLLVILVHMGGGQPARVSALSPYQISNTLEKRSLFYTGNCQFLIIQCYSKNTSQMGVAKNVARFLPLNLSRLLLTYFVYIRPIEMILCDLVLGSESKNAYSIYMFPNRGGRMNPETLRDIIVAKFNSILGFAIKCSDYRQMCDLIVEKHLAGFIIPLLGVDPIFHRQAGHSAETAHLHYGICEDDPRLVSRKLYLQFHAASKAWHDLMRFEAQGITLSGEDSNDSLRRQSGIFGSHCSLFSSIVTHPHIP